MIIRPSLQYLVVLTLISFCMWEAREACAQDNVEVIDFIVPTVDVMADAGGRPDEASARKVSRNQIGVPLKVIGDSPGMYRVRAPTTGETFWIKQTQAKTNVRQLKCRPPLDPKLPPRATAGSGAECP